MKNYIYKVIIAAIAIILVFKLTIGKEISQINKKIISQIEIQIPTYEKNNLPSHLQKIKAIKPGSRSL